MTTSVSVPESTSGFGVFFDNSKKAVGGFIRRHKALATFLLVVFIVLTGLFREEWQPWAVITRRYFTPIFVSLGVVAVFWVMSRRATWGKRITAVFFSVAIVAGCVFVYEYAALYVRYQSLHVETIDILPETAHERIQPLASIHGLAQTFMGDSRNPAPPDFVRAKNKVTGAIEYKWTMGVEPKLWVDKIFGTVDEVISVSGTDSSPEFTPESRKQVRFGVGEGLWFSSNATTAAIRSFSPDMFLSYEPADVRYLENDAHEIVEVISLIRWRGFFFPYPEFGGVLVVPQEEGTLSGWGSRVLFGSGKWVSPERIAEFPYLRGQNILSYRVSRYIGESMRFMNGALALMPWYHQGDVRIPDAKENGNKQPYTTYFKEVKGMPGMLYHYIALEPYLDGKHGLVASVLIPADGSSRVFVYKHEERKESLMGVSMVPTFVMDSKKEYTWKNSIPIEARPFVRSVDGKNRLFWLTTVVTKKDSSVGVAKPDGKEPKQGSGDDGVRITSGIPGVALVDAGTQEVFWVDPRNPSGWITPAPVKK